LRDRARATRTSASAPSWRRWWQEHCFYHLEAPIERVTGWDTPYPHAQEWPISRVRSGAQAFARTVELTMGIHVIKMPDIGEASPR